MVYTSDSIVNIPLQRAISVLLRFSASNFRSFHDEVSLQLTPSKEERHQDHVVRPGTSKFAGILKTAAIYGANGAGKSNLVDAISFAQNFILRGSAPDALIDVTPFKLQSKIAPSSKLEFVILVGSTIFTYGFLVSKEHVKEEWLFSESILPRKQEVKYFERITDAKGKIKVEIGSSLARKDSRNREFLSFIAQGTRPNQLFLTECREKNVKKLSPISDWFRNTLNVVTADAEYTNLLPRASDDEQFNEFLCSILKGADTGVERVVAEEYPLDLDARFSDVPDDFRSFVQKAVSQQRQVRFSDPKGQAFGIRYRNESPVLMELKTVHKGIDGRDYNFSFGEESDGTQRLMHLAPMLFDFKKSEQVYVIDELDRRLHPLLSKYFLTTFLNPKMGFKRGQLLFTTHDTNLLDQDSLRRDEVWFVEKGDGGNSTLYSLADFKIRHDLKIRKGYLNGRFGAIPFLGDVNALGLTN
jgi:hypothetical protein